MAKSTEITIGMEEKIKQLLYEALSEDQKEKLSRSLSEENLSNLRPIDFYQPEIKLIAGQLGSF
jgi:hypothetical protein